MTPQDAAPLFAAAGALVGFALGYWQRSVVARIDRRASCAHRNRKRIHAMGRDEFPVDVCDECGWQEHVKPKGD